MRLAIPFALLLAATTASRQGCGKGNGTPPAYDACAGKACGDVCKACAPDDRDCFETDVVKACDPLHRCVPFVEGLCAAAQEPCAGKACGAECVWDPPCRDSDPPCMMPSYAGHCDPSGACIPGVDPLPPEVCAPPPPSWGCVGKACGDSCGVCPEGTDPSRCPVPTFAPTACDARLQCVTAGTFTCPPADPCAGKACGADCDPCGGMCMYPARTSCDYAGRCVPWSEWLCYDPCAGKQCHDACTICPPGATGCAETMVLKACDANGRCVMDSPMLACPP